MFGQKYKSKKTIIDGISFSSQLEARFYTYLTNDPRITIKELQPAFILQEGFIHEGKKIRPIEYVADFTINVDGDIYHVDSKGFETPDFKIKKKIWLYKYGKEHRLLVVKSIKELNSIIFNQGI